MIPTDTKQGDLQQILGGDHALLGPVDHDAPEAEGPAHHGQPHEGLEEDDVLEDVDLGLHAAREVRELRQSEGGLKEDWC